MTPHNKLQPRCLAPWVHSFVNINGDRALCCGSILGQGGPKGSISNQSFEQWWNSSYLKKARRLMLSNSPPRECLNCLGDGETNPEGLWKYFSTHFSHLTEELVNETLPDGSFSGPPRSLDYRISNQCNFACRMCSSYFSSRIRSWEESAPSSATQAVTQKEFSELLERAPVSELYFASSEPLLSKQTWDTLFKLTAEGKAKGISLRINTNLSVISHQGKTLIELLAPFQSTRFILSFDGPGKIGEFVRDGLVWSEWKSNFDEISRNFGIDNVKLHITLTLPTLLGYKELAHFLQEVPCAYTVSNCENGGNDALLSPLSLDQRTAHSVLSEVDHFLKENPHPRLLTFKSAIQKLKSAPYSEKLSKKMANHLASALLYHQKIDWFRDGLATSEWLKEQPQLQSWLEKILSRSSLPFLSIHRRVSSTLPLLLHPASHPESQNYLLRYFERNPPKAPPFLLHTFTLRHATDPKAHLQQLGKILPPGSILSIIDEQTTPFHRLLRHFKANSSEPSALPAWHLAHFLNALSKENSEIATFWKLRSKRNVPILPRTFLRKDGAAYRVVEWPLYFISLLCPRVFSLHQHVVLERLE